MTGAEALAAAKAAAKIAKTAIKVAKKMKELYDIDQRKRVVFNKDFFSGTFREKVMVGGQERVVPDFRNDDFQIIDRRVTIFATGDRDPFCDASSLSPEKILAIDLLRPAATHDAIYQYQEDIAKAWGWPVEDVRELADHAHGNELQHEARKQSSAPMRILGEVVAHVAHFCTRTFGGIYHRTHAGRNAVVAALVLCAAGCAEIPQVFDPSDERPDVEIVLREDVLAAGAGGDDVSLGGPAVMGGGRVGPPEAAPAPAAEAPSQPNGRQIGDLADDVDFAALDWRWGGFNGARAVLSDCRIAALKVTSNGLSYKWSIGGCEDLDRSCSHSKPCCTCALFCRVDGKWIGGKFDHISTDRKTRGFENMAEGYGGWDPSALSRADAYAFVILDDGGRRRTNVIKCGR